MPKDFKRCIARGGRVRAKSLPRGRYITLCFLGGKSFAGEVKRRKPRR